MKLGSGVESKIDSGIGMKSLKAKGTAAAAVGEMAARQRESN